VSLRAQLFQKWVDLIHPLSEGEAGSYPSGRDRVASALADIESRLAVLERMEAERVAEKGGAK